MNYQYQECKRDATKNYNFLTTNLATLMKSTNLRKIQIAKTGLRRNKRSE